MGTYTYINATEAIRINALPKNLKLHPVAVRSSNPTESDVWRDGWGIGFFFGGVFSSAVYLALTWLNG